MLFFIAWRCSGELLIGSLSIHLYSLFFALGLLSGGLLVIRLMGKHTSSQSYLIYAFLGILIGARVGHCLFYEPNYYLNHINEIFLPYRTISGQRVFVGFSGLASHIGTLGLMISLYVFSLRNRMNYFSVCDVFAVATPLVGGFIRIGNLMNSEILGKATDMPWAFVFENIDAIPRHPAQLYEAIWYFLLFVALIFIYKSKKTKYFRYGFVTGLGLLGVSVFRFFIEFIKEPQEMFQNHMSLNMGQLLSLPFVMLGIVLVFFTSRNYRKSNL